MEAEKRMTIMTSEPFQKIIRDRPDSFGSFEEAVGAIGGQEGCSRHQAMEKAADAYPDLLQQYRDEGCEAVRKAVADAAVIKRDPRAVQEFELVVAGIMERKAVGRARAMQMARIEKPELFRAYQEA